MTTPQSWPQIPPIRTGIKGRCPRCGEGSIFDGFLTGEHQWGQFLKDYQVANW